MKKRNLTLEKKTERVRRERDPIPWRYCLLTMVCGLLLAGGFFWAARQHFSAIDLGIKNAKLRQQKENLESEARRLYLSKEISLSPAEIKKAARKLGLQGLTAASIQIISPTPKTAATVPNTPPSEQVIKKKDAPLREFRKVEKTVLTAETEIRTKDGKSKVQVLSETSSRTQIARK
jgi:hypothetical protein